MYAPEFRQVQQGTLQLNLCHEKIENISVQLRQTKRVIDCCIFFQNCSNFLFVCVDKGTTTSTCIKTQMTRSPSKTTAKKKNTQNWHNNQFNMHLNCLNCNKQHLNWVDFMKKFEKCNKLIHFVSARKRR